MGAEVSFIVSDLHLGSEYFFHRDFLSWLDHLPPGAQLILNGDIIDDPDQPLGPEHQAVFQRLIQESFQRPIIWVLGNHDAEVARENSGRIRFVPHWQIGQRLLVVHGSELDELMPRHELFKRVFKLLHRLRLALGFRKVHVAAYAKKWAFLYRVLNDHVANNALCVARSRGFQAVACGHTHAAMEMEHDGMRYFNSGAWTEEPLYYVVIDEGDIDLRTYQDGKS